MLRNVFIALFVLCTFISPAYPAQFEEIGKTGVTLKFEKGTKGAALEILGLIPALKKRIRKRSGLKFDFPFEMIIYRNRSDFVDMAGNDMIAAFAVPARNLIVLDLSRMSVHPLNIELITIHEMTHLVLHHYIREENLPKWFDEGVAQWVSGISEMINPHSGDLLKKAVIYRKVIPFYDIENRFPADRNGFALAYEESLNIIEYIESQYGETAVRNIILRLERGERFSDAVRNVVPEGLVKVERSWRRSLEIKYTWLGYVSNNIYWILFVAGALLTVFGFLRLRKRIRDYPDDNDEDINY
ncbi:hypothetical protein BMS3Bbin05_00792 [bacterium BMS3Bbin05]|nr:hypothetical protein BMS3Bbin05_00792 [bacterium BMS3Bbin05]HDL20838.1 hypothetical protein [Nitrospirota bacterium]HDO23295.1 hypothetical protein [Nitrospirota bacterium]HDZ87471.1 hypothetical protein [Nitrospirota bacterium]